MSCPSQRVNTGWTNTDLNYTSFNHIRVNTDHQRYACMRVCVCACVLNSPGTVHVCMYACVHGLNSFGFLHCACVKMFLPPCTS